MQRSIRWVVTALILTLLTASLLGACRPQQGPRASILAPDQSAGSSRMETVLYLFQPSSLRLVRYVSDDVADSPDELLALLKNPGKLDELVSPLPDEIYLKVIAIVDKTISIEIAMTGTPHWGTRREAILFDSVVLTLCELPEVEAVRFVVRGGDYLGRVDLSKPFDRERLLAPQESYEFEK